MDELIEVNSAGIIAKDRETLSRLFPLLSDYGLELSEGEVDMLAFGHVKALEDRGRVELGGGVLRALVYAFCDSPYADRGSFAGQISDLQDCFYYYRGELEGRMSDEELIDLMKAAFESSGGSVEYIEGLGAEGLMRAGEEFDGYRRP